MTTYQNLRFDRPYGRYFVPGTFDAYTIENITKNKDYLFNVKIEDILTRLTGCFEYDNLPPEIRPEMLERYLFEDGKCAFVQHNGTYYALRGEYGANPDAYGVPTQFIIANPYIPLNHTYDLLNEKIIIIKNDPYANGIMDIILPNAALMTEGDITFYNLIINARAMGIMSADDDTAAESCREYFRALERGDHHVITTTEFSSEHGVESKEPYNNTSSIPYFLDLYQYIKSRLYADLGIQMTNNLKREYISDGEQDAGSNYAITLINVMLKERQRALDQINETFGLNITVKLSSAWELEQAELEQEVTDEPVTLDSTDNEHTDEPENTPETEENGPQTAEEPKEEHNDEPKD